MISYYHCDKIAIKLKNFGIDVLCLYDVFESEFARPLNQTEMQMLSDWIKCFDSKLILYALKEASMYRSLNMNYISRILESWQQKGITSTMVEEGKHLGRKKNT